MKSVTAVQQKNGLDLHITEAGHGEAYLVATAPDSFHGSLRATDAHTDIAAVLDRIGRAL